MAKITHFSHECGLTSPEIIAYGVCNICFKDEPVEFSCKPCNFDLCKTCSKLPQMVSHGFHPEHSLEFRLFQYDRKPEYVVCSACGNMSSGSLYECETCEIYLDLDCALQMNIVTGWDVKELLHFSHAHLLRRCRPGSDAIGSCLLCERPISPSSICYGCVHCYLFFHERCLDLPTQIQHPVHSAHPLRRLDYIETCGYPPYCDACKDDIHGLPLSCLECDFDLHMRCADSLLRGLMHESHEHRLFYVAKNAHRVFRKGSGPCHICMRNGVIKADSYYRCVECDLKFHFECLEIPESLVTKSFHIHPLVCDILRVDDEDDSLELCGVCETMMHVGHHAYLCQDCDFIGHIECILRKEEPSPLYLKHLYSCSKSVTQATKRVDSESDKLEGKLMVNDTGHIHGMRPASMSEVDESGVCDICKVRILGSPCTCETCSFQTHRLCAEMGQESRHRLHKNHPLTLLPQFHRDFMATCDICKMTVHGFFLFCRICNFMIDISCALKGKHLLQVLGQKVIGTTDKYCLSKHILLQAIVSRSCTNPCALCDERLYGQALSCMECGDIYHPLCAEVVRQEIFRHPLHPDHHLKISLISGSNCIACQVNIPKCGYHCSVCKVSFHIECIKPVNASGMIRSHRHNLYNFWIDDTRLTPPCSVCARPCGVSFYGCVDCNFRAHVECIMFPATVKNKRHQHTVEQTYSSDEKSCSICGSLCSEKIYSCNHCKDVFHLECIMSMDDREVATQEEQLGDIYLMYLERNLFNLLEENKS